MSQGPLVQVRALFVQPLLLWLEQSPCHVQACSLTAAAAAAAPPAAGEKETRAWTIRSGMTAPQAAGVIHSDFEKGFIRAETIAFNDFIKHGGYSGSKEAGALRLEGKEYVVQEGDVMLFRFNV